MPEALGLVLALLALAATLAVAVARPPRVSEAVVAAGAALALVGVGALSPGDARDALDDLAPTVGFLAALLVLAEGCRREGLFAALGGLMAGGAHGSPRRLLALVFVVAAGVTAVLSLDATVVLLTPIVFATTARLRTSPTPHVYACAHLANSASLLLPVSNLTNLLAFHATGLSFTRFAAIMAAPWVAAVAVEWIVFKRFFALDLGRPRTASRVEEPQEHPQIPRFAVAVVGLTLAGFAVSSLIGIEPVWVAIAGALAISAPALARRLVTPSALARAAEPGFLVFVLGLGVIVRAAGTNGLGSAVGTVLPGGDSIVDLLAIAVLSALLANLVNNLPATLIIVPVVAVAGPGAVLAALIGVNVGPNLTYSGSLATLLWRRVLHAENTDVNLGEYTRLGALTVPAVLCVSTVLLWLSLQGLT